jgi:hypothetical protein
VDWIHVTQDNVNTVMKLNVSKRDKSLDQLSDYQLLKKDYVP